MIHHNHIKCDDCGERHTPGNPSECIEVLKGKIADREQVMKEKDEQIFSLRSILKKIATSVNMFTMISLARKALGAEPDPMTEIRRRAIENEQYVP